MPRLEGGGSIDEEVDKGDRANEVSTRGASLDGDSIMGASLDVLNLSNGCVTASTCTEQE